MASTAVGAQLTMAHANAQEALARRTMAELLGVWDLLDPSDVDGTEARWVEAVTRVLQRQHGLSAGLAARYLLAFRGVELGGRAPGVPPVAALVRPLPVAQVVTSMRVTGPYTLKRLTASGLGLDKARATALVRTLGAGERLALLGGRNTISRAVGADPRALGYQRVTRGSACEFCQMLAGRGAVYKSKRSAGSGHQYHDHCHCTVEIVYRRDSAPPLEPQEGNRT